MFNTIIAFRIIYCDLRHSEEKPANIADKIRDSSVRRSRRTANDVFTSTIAIRSMLQMTGFTMNLLRSFVIVSRQSARERSPRVLCRAFLGHDN